MLAPGRNVPVGSQLRANDDAAGFGPWRYGPPAGSKG
jgi:hypothetical protein